MKKLIQKFKKIADTYPNLTAYKIKEQEISYKELWNKSYKLSLALKSHGKSSVIIYGHKSVKMIVSILGCIMSERTYVPVDITTPTDRLLYIAEKSKASLIIKNEEISVPNVCCMDLYDIIKEFYQDDNNGGVVYNSVNSDNRIAYIIFTSGSTGYPKGVPISYKNLNNFVNWISNFEILQIFRNINVLNQASFSFDLSVADVFYALMNGHTLFGLDKDSQSDFDNIFSIIKENRINLTVTTPTFAKLLLLNSDFNCNNFPDLRCMYFCGEALEVATVKKLKKRFPKLNVINAYGPTEATSAVSAVVVTDEMLENELLPVGRFETSAVNIAIEDDEIVLKGQSVFGGYLDGGKNGCYTENGVNCYKTGDLGYAENEYIYCRGRKDSQIKFKGYRIEPGDIENNLLNIDGITQAAVIPKYMGSTNVVKTIHAYISVEKVIDVKYIKNELLKTLPDYMIPKSILIIDEIPINNNGKIDRKRLKEL